MKMWNWKEITESVGMLAILFGMYFVYEELKQSGTIARAELSAETSRGFAAIEEQIRDTDFANILAKSIDAPAKLTHSERLQMNSFLDGVIRQFVRERYYYDLGIFGEWTSTIQENAPKYFSSDYGQAYWSVKRDEWGPEFGAAVDAALANDNRTRFYKTFDAELATLLKEN